MNITEKEALEMCRDLWEWLEENPSKSKMNWPKIQEKEILNDCPCCEFTATNEHEDNCPQCKICPLLGKWTDRDSFLLEQNKNTNPCVREGSPYDKWQRSGSWGIIDRVKYARQIKQNAIDTLKELGYED